MSGEKPLFVSDWDDVCYEFIRHYFRYYNHHNGTEFQPNQVLDYDLTLLLGQDVEHIINTIDDFHENGESVEHGLVPSTLEVLPLLALKRNIVIVTARKKRFKSRIQDMIDHYIPGTIAEIYLKEDYEHYGSKGAFARKLGAVTMVDDHVKNIISAEAHGIRGLLRNMPNNIKYPLTVERVDDWYDIYNKEIGEPVTVYPSSSDMLSA